MSCTLDQMIERLQKIRRIHPELGSSPIWVPVKEVGLKVPVAKIDPIFDEGKTRLIATLEQY